MYALCGDRMHFSFMDLYISESVHITCRVRRAAGCERLLVSPLMLQAIEEAEQRVHMNAHHILWTTVLSCAVFKDLTVSRMREHIPSTNTSTPLTPLSSKTHEQ